METSKVLLIINAIIQVYNDWKTRSKIFNTLLNCSDFNFQFRWLNSQWYIISSEVNITCNYTQLFIDVASITRQGRAKEHSNTFWTVNITYITFRIFLPSEMIRSINIWINKRYRRLPQMSQLYVVTSWTMGGRWKTLLNTISFISTGLPVQSDHSHIRNCTLSRWAVYLTSSSEHLRKSAR